MNTVNIWLFNVIFRQDGTRGHLISLQSSGLFQTGITLPYSNGYYGSSHCLEKDLW